MNATLPILTSFSVLIGMFASLLFAWFIFYLGVRNTETSQRKVALKTILIGGILLVWYVIAFALGINEFFLAAQSETIQFPNIVYTFLPLALGVAWLSLSNKFQIIVDSIPQHWIVGVQIYRALGIFFLISYAQGLLPGEFAIPAGIGDVFIGLTAPIVAYLYLKRREKVRKIAVFWNITGIADLVIALALGFLTAPSAFQLLSLDAPNQLITDFPLVMIPAFGVPLSILLHLFSLRVLLKNRKNLETA